MGRDKTMTTQFKIGKLYRKIGGGSIVGILEPIHLNDIVMIVKVMHGNKDPHFYNTLSVLVKDKIFNIVQPSMWWEEIA